MKITCPNCKTGYQIDPSKIPAQGAHTRCKKCQTRFLVQKPPAEIKTKVQAPQARLADASRPTAGPTPATPPDSPSAAAQNAPLSEEEKQVAHYAAEGKEAEAANLLLEMIKQSARQKDFANAERLRDKLYEVAPLALNEIVSANETIEAEKSKSIDPKHLELWTALYNVLENDEASELYYAMKPNEIKAGQILFEKGAQDSNLYFVQEGRLKMVYYDPKQKRDVELKDIVPGQTTNADAFFSFTVCTCSVVAAKNSRLTYLDQDALEKWRGRFASIEPKLQHFCNKQEKVGDLVKKAGIDLRATPRFVVSLPAMLQMLGSDGQPTTKPFSVSLFDISAGGVSFGMKINKRSEAAKLLGQRLMMQTAYSVSNTQQKISRTGKIVAAHLQPFGESSVHVQFEENLPDETMKDIEKLAEEPADGI